MIDFFAGLATWFIIDTLLSRYYMKKYAAKCSYDCESCKYWKCPAKTCLEARKKEEKKVK